MTPLVTVCLPVFNNQDFLIEAISSVRCQTYPNIQIIAIDDCSMDDSYSILKSYESDNFIVHKNPQNLGMKGNWNKCLELSDGKYIKMMGADDILQPDCISKQVAILEAFDINLVSSNRFIISDQGKILLKLKYPFDGYVSGKKAIQKLVGAGRNIIGEPVAVLMRRDALIEIGGFSALNHYVIDIETWAKLFREKGFFAMDQYLSSFRVSQNSISSKEGLNQIQSVFEFISSYSMDDVGFFTKVRGYLFAAAFGVIRNIVLGFSNRQK